MSTPPTFDLLHQSEERANCQPWNWFSLDDFIEEGFDPSDAKAWLDADVAPPQARLYERLGMSPAQAWGWRMVPEVVQSFMDGGFDQDDAWEWANLEIFGHEAMFWRHGGYGPEQAAALRAHTRPLAQCVLWALTGLAPADALDHASHGANPADFLRPPVLESDEDPTVIEPPF